MTSSLASVLKNRPQRPGFKSAEPNLRALEKLSREKRASIPEALKICDAAVRSREDSDESEQTAVRVTAVRTLCEVIKKQNPPIQRGISLDDLENVFDHILSWTSTFPGSDSTASILNQQTRLLLHKTLKDLIYVGAKKHGNAFTTSIMSKGYTIQKQLGYDPISEEQKLLLSEVEKELLGTELSYFGLSPAKVHAFTSEDFSKMVRNFEGLTGSNMETAAKVQHFAASHRSFKSTRVSGFDLSYFLNMKELCDLVEGEVETLILEDCQVTKKSIIAINRLVDRAPNLKTLCISGCGITEEVARKVFSSLLTKSCDLENLDLSYNELGNEALADLSDVIEKNRKLKSIQLHHNRISESSEFLTAYVDESLSTHPTLTELNFSDQRTPI